MVNNVVHDIFLLPEVISYFIFGSNPSAVEVNKNLAIDFYRTKIKRFKTYIFLNCRGSMLPRGPLFLLLQFFTHTHTHA